MRKLLVLLTAILLFAGGLLAQKTITGKVTDAETKLPVLDARVVIAGGFEIDRRRRRRIFVGKVNVEEKAAVRVRRAVGTGD